MKLVFEKDETGVISTKLKNGASTIEFNYIKMIENLIKGESLEDSEFIGDIDQADVKKIEALITEIKEASATQPSLVTSEVP